MIRKMEQTIRDAWVRLIAQPDGKLVKAYLDAELAQLALENEQELNVMTLRQRQGAAQVTRKLLDFSEKGRP